jgi:hypothetical protein
MANSEPIEIPFLGEWSQLRRERRELRERLAKLEYEQGRFSDSVLARVRIDYERRIHDLETRSIDLADRARQEVSSLTGAVAQQETEVRACQLGLEEFELREKLGEQLDPESARRAGDGRAELARLEDDLKAMRELLERVKAIAEGRTGSSPIGAAPAPTGVVAQSQPGYAKVLPLPLPPPAPTAPPPPPPQLPGTAPHSEKLSPLPAMPPVESSFPPYSRTAAHASTAIPRLVPVESADSSDHFALRPRTIVGRTAECDLRLPVGTVSRRHAEIEFSEEGWRIHDLQSENGTWVNGDRAYDRLLIDGDRLQFGTVCLVFKTS